MNETGFRHVYGPVPSRRLGRSLGVDLVPFKTCTYDCIYCQLGRTTNKTIERKEYVAVDEILDEMKRKLDAGPAPDYITIAGSGEPTLNVRIGHLIRRIKDLTRTPVAVLTNGSLLWMREVGEALMEADIVLPSLDAGDERLFRYVNRPHREIAFEKLVNGLIEFTEHFRGSVWLEVFLLAGVTGLPPEVERIATISRRIQPEQIQLNTVSRPPAEDFAFAVPRQQMEQFKVLFSSSVEVVNESESDEALTTLSRDATDADILALLRRRPCTVQGISAGLGMHASEVTKRLHVLIRRGMAKTIRKDNCIFFDDVRAK
jgi:wyosine [tRNA(Phe)-imidazoG37] synthetase (radical SAM superfamily)